MKTIMTFAGFALGLILFLCITVNGKPIFNHIYRVISPVTVASQNMTEKLFAKSFASTRDYTKKLFSNSVPKVKGDTVRSKMSGIKKGGDPQEKITAGEKQELDQLIRNHR